MTFTDEQVYAVRDRLILTYEPVPVGVCREIMEATAAMPDEKSIFGSDVESLETINSAIDHFIAGLNGAVLEISHPALKDPFTITIDTTKTTK